MRPFLSVAFVGCLLALAAGCSGGAPSEDDIATALQQSIDHDLAAARVRAGPGIADLIPETRIKEVRIQSTRQLESGDHEIDISLTVLVDGNEVSGRQVVTMTEGDSGWRVISARLH